MRSPFDILEAYERRSLAHAVQLPGRQFAQDLWRGVGYRVGQRRLVSDFREVVEIVPMPPAMTGACSRSRCCRAPLNSGKPRPEAGHRPLH